MTDLARAISEAIEAYEYADIACTCPPDGPSKNCLWDDTRDDDRRTIRTKAFLEKLAEHGFSVEHDQA